MPTVSLAHLSEVELRAYALADNRLAEMAGWDDDLLALELGELAGMELEFNLEITGFDTVDLDQLFSRTEAPSGSEPEDDPIPEPSITVAIFAGALLGLRPDVLVARVTRR